MQDGRTLGAKLDQGWFDIGLVERGQFLPVVADRPFDPVNVFGIQPGDIGL